MEAVLISINVNMKVIIMLVHFFLISNLCLSQNFQGKAAYLSKTKFEFDFGNRKVPEDRKKEIQERMDKAMQKNFVLDFNKVASIYEEQAKLDGPKEGGGRGAMFASMMGGPSVGTSYKNIIDKESKRAVEFFGKNFLIEDKLTPYAWKLENDVKKIGKYTCYKATTSIEKKDNPFAKDRDSLSTSTLVTVWYTPEIPVSLGPDKFWGLPGLILSVNAGDTQIICTKIVLNIEEKREIKAPKKGKKVTEEEFEKIVADKTVELKERFKNRKPGSGGGRGKGPR